MNDMKAVFTVICTFCILTIYAQFSPPIIETTKRFKAGINMGIGTSFTDRTYLLNYQSSVTIDYSISERYSIQFAPKYTWLKNWNEHYLTLPFHVRKKFGNNFSVFAGPALTLDVGFFKDLGVSAGVNYYISQRSSIMLSAFTFTLYNYHIDYLFIPVSLSYNFTFLN